MTDVAVATAPYVDLTFLGLPEIPGPGQERFAADLLRTPGGGAITAVGCARLGLDTALAAPLGSDEDGGKIRAALAEDGVRTVPPFAGPTATTVILPVAGDRAMVTYDPGARTRAEDLRELAPRAVIADLQQLDAAPDGAWIYATCGDDGARRYTGGLPAAVARARALLVNAAEAAQLTGGLAPHAAAKRLAREVRTVVVTRGADGAVAIIDGVDVDVPGFDVGPPVDTTGAGDLFAAAFVWADLHGSDPRERVVWAALYAALSVTVPTGAGGAVAERRLIEEGSRRGLARRPAPAGHDSSASPEKERYT